MNLEDWDRIRNRIESLETEVRFLRRGQARTDDGSFETLLEHLHDSLRERPWTSSEVFEQAEDNPLLYAAMVRCLGPVPTIQGLSKLLMQRRGQCGEYTVRYLKRGNSGSLFTVQQCCTPALEKRSTVQRTKGGEVETMTKERKHILDELERFHLGKLDEIRVKRGVATLDGSRPIVIDGAVNLKIDPAKKELVVSWGA